MINMNKLNMMIFLPMLILSTMISLSSNNWMNSWIGMEINLMSFIPMMLTNKINKNESFMNYFIIQSICSSMILFSSLLILNYLYTNMLFYMNINIINLSILTKMGSAPIFMWYIKLMKNLSWNNCLILSTWQKIIPFFLINNFKEFKLIFYTNMFISLINSVISVMNNLNLLSIRSIIAFSSLNHLSWMIMNIMLSSKLWILYFFNYSIMLFSLIHTMNYLNIFYINQIIINKLENKFFSILITLIMMSLAGMPPLTVFMIKWLSFKMFISFKLNLLIMWIMSMSSTLAMFIYMRMAMSTLTFYNSIQKNNFIMKNINFNKMNKLMLSMFMIMFMNLMLI
uniref:NADH-ubiquinone oxidoreductase chain 2 n=1 Tax=Vanhornia eucnemidarum TaxID=32432 RepID=Q0H2G2_9HYME|nr:NADH dehydrogenase subunit 2 [Vanhornia eucnemidarum]